jgi:hypothetical protein
VRSIVPLALVLLLLAIGLRTAVVFESSSGSQRGGARATNVLVTSRGHMLPAAALQGGDESVLDTIAVGDLLLTQRGETSGLRTVMLRPDLELEFFLNFDLARDPQGIVKIADSASIAPEGSVLVLAVQGDVRPASGDSTVFDETVRTLGARVSPFRAERASWALVSLRRADGWHALAEAYSETQGIDLTTTVLANPLERGREALGELVHVRGEGPLVLDLAGVLGWAESDQGTQGFDRWARLQQQTKSSIRLRRGHTSSEGDGAVGSVRFPNVRLGAAPSFSVALGVPSYHAEGYAGALCELVVDGEVVGHRYLDEPEVWHPWVQDLADFAHRTVDVELRVRPIERDDEDVSGAARVAWILWGEPVLTWDQDS